jgi:hypothetical protein
MDMQKMAGLVSSSRKAKPYLQQQQQQQARQNPIHELLHAHAHLPTGAAAVVRCNGSQQSKLYSCMLAASTAACQASAP